MKQKNQQPERHDAQDVIAAMHLLMRSLHSSEREALLSALLHEQNECVEVGDPERQSDDTTEIAQPEYPIQPLVLDSEESHSSSESHSDPASEATHEVSSEGRRREKVLATYASFLFPLTASFTRRRWWGYLAVSTILLLTMSLSTLASYKAGMQAGMATDKTAVVSVSAVGCMQPAIIGRVTEGIQLLPSGKSVAISRILLRQGALGPVMWAYYIGGNNPHTVSLIYRENIQCSPLPTTLIAQP